MEKVSLQFDKTISVPPGATVRSGYVPMHRVRCLCREPMAIGDVERKYELAKQNAPASLFPAPMGRWNGDTFELLDGRHTKIAYEMLGYSHLLVMWVDDPREDA